MHASPSVHTGPDLLLWAGIVAGACLLFAAGVVVSVLLSRRGEGIAWSKVFLAGISLLWLIPIFGVLALVSYKLVGNVERTIAVQVQESAADELHVRFEESQLLVEQLSQTSNRDGNSVSEAQVKSSSSVPAAVTQPLPDWVNDKQILADDKQLVVLSSQQYATVEEGDAAIRVEAQNRIQQDLRQRFHYEGAPPVPTRELEKALGRRHVEEITRQAGANTFRVFRVHRQLELSPALRKTLEPMWREQNGKQRLWGLASLAGFVTLIVGTLAGYLRLDTRTGSAYRGRLRFAAVCLIVAGGVAAMGLIIA